MPLFAVVCPDLQKVRHPILDSAGVVRDVEKLDLSKLVEKTLREEALQTTFLFFLDIFYPPNFRCFAENGVFQQPRDHFTQNPCGGTMSVIEIQQQASWATANSMAFIDLPVLEP